MLEFETGLMQRHAIMVAAVVDDLEITRLTKKVWRYARAIYQTLHDRPTGEVHVLVRSINYGPMVVAHSGSKREFRKDDSLHCEVLHFERQRGERTMQDFSLQRNILAKL